MIGPQGDARHIGEKRIPLCPLPSYPLTHHGSFTFHSRVLTPTRFRVPYCRIVYPLLYMWFIYGISGVIL